jgi:hypothetical protein
MTKLGRSNLHGLWLACAVLLAGSVPAQASAQSTIRPAFDLEGAWQADASRPMQCFRSETEVTCIMVNDGFSHEMHMLYVSPTQLEGVLVRRNRGNGCVTHMDIAITMLSSSSFSLTWRALDASCDLAAGQTGTDPAYNRVH